MRDHTALATANIPTTINRRTFLRSTAGAAIVGGGCLMHAPSVASSPRAADIDPIFAEIERHRAARDAFEAASKGATDEYLDSAEYAAIDDAERSAWDDLIETQMTTAAGLAAFAVHILHSPALGCDIQNIRAILTTVAVASAKFAHPGGEAGR